MKLVVGVWPSDYGMCSHIVVDIDRERALQIKNICLRAQQAALAGDDGFSGITYDDYSFDPYEELDVNEVVKTPIKHNRVVQEKHLYERREEDVELEFSPHDYIISGGNFLELDNPPSDLEAFEEQAERLDVGSLNIYYRTHTEKPSWAIGWEFWIRHDPNKYATMEIPLDVLNDALKKEFDEEILDFLFDPDKVEIV